MLGDRIMQWHATKRLESKMLYRYLHIHLDGGVSMMSEAVEIYAGLLADSLELESKESKWQSVEAQLETVELWSLKSIKKIHDE